MDIVINVCFGGFGLSHEAVMLYAKLSGFKLYGYVDKRDKQSRLKVGELEPYTQKSDSFVIYYYKRKLKPGEKHKDKDYFSVRDIDRADKTLVKVVRKLGKKASGELSSLKVVTIPDGVEWEIDNYDGRETIHEKHRSWG